MPSTKRLFLERAENELDLAGVILRVTTDIELQRKAFHLSRTQSFYSGVITHSYYAIFYGAKAYLSSKDVATTSPNVHKKTFEAFKRFVEKGIVDVELLTLYRKTLLKADVLLGIFQSEKKKRGHFTYQSLAQANHKPAEDSLNNAKRFFKHIFNLLEASP